VTQERKPLPRGKQDDQRQKPADDERLQQLALTRFVDFADDRILIAYSKSIPLI